MNANMVIDRYTKLHGVPPPIQYLVNSAKISTGEAERLLSQKELFNEPIQKPTQIQEIATFPGEPSGVPDDRKQIPRILGKRVRKSNTIHMEPTVSRVELSERSIPSQHTISTKGDELKHGLIDRALLKFNSSIKGLVFLFASVADMALAAFFYWSLGFDPVSKVVLAVWGLVQTSGKVWAWSERRNGTAVWAAILSVVATVSIFLAVVDTQNTATIAHNTTQKSAIVASLENQIDAKNTENGTLAVRLANTPPDYVGASKTITNTIKANDEALSALRSELSKALNDENTVKPKEFELSAWKIFSQLTNFAWNDTSHIFALILILGIAVFFELLIYATTPRSIRQK
jgi:hypothetical protein